jgi:hypothetical protein
MLGPAREGEAVQCASVAMRGSRRNRERGPCMRCREPSPPMGMPPCVGTMLELGTIPVLGTMPMLGTMPEPCGTHESCESRRRGTASDKLWTELGSRRVPRSPSRAHVHVWASGEARSALPLDHDGRPVVH